MTKYAGSKAAVVCASFLSFAVLTAAVAAREAGAGAPLAPPVTVIRRIFTPRDDAAPVPSPIAQSPRPVTRTRGS